MRIFGAYAGAIFAAELAGSSSGDQATTQRPRQQLQESAKPIGLATPKPTRRRRKRPRRQTSTRSCCSGGPTSRRRLPPCSGSLRSRRWLTWPAELGAAMARRRRAASGRPPRGQAATSAAGLLRQGPRTQPQRLQQRQQQRQHRRQQRQQLRRRQRLRQWLWRRAWPQGSRRWQPQRRCSSRRWLRSNGRLSRWFRGSTACSPN